MKNALVILCALFMLSACCHTAPQDNQVFHKAGFDIKQGQDMEDFFDDFEEPMHTAYKGRNNVKWTYYVDYNAQDDEGEIVRYCDLDKYQKHSLCPLVVEFYRQKVSYVRTSCL